MTFQMDNTVLLDGVKRIMTLSAEWITPTETAPGVLMLKPGSYVFKRHTDLQGWPSLNKGLCRTQMPFSLQGSVLTILSRDASADTFRLAPESLDTAQTYLENYGALVRYTLPYVGSIAADCAEPRWPKVVHPFFAKHAAGRVDAAALLTFLCGGSEELLTLSTGAVPWTSDTVSLLSGTDRLSVKTGCEENRYKLYVETPDSILLSAYEYAVGFFDDSDHERSSTRRIEFEPDPHPRLASNALGGKRLQKAKLTELPILLKNPFGLKGYFIVT